MGVFRRATSAVVHLLKPVTDRIPQWKQEYYFHIHITTFIALGFMASTIIYIIELSKNSVTYVDALFSGYSAITASGLGVVDHASLALVSQLIILLLICMSGLSISPLPGVFIKTMQSYQRMNFARKWARSHNYFVSSWEQKRGLFLRFKQIIGLARIPVTDYEFLAMVLLFIILLISISTFLLLGFLVMSIWISLLYTKEKLENYHPLYISLFLTISSFNNAGISPFYDGLVRFSSDFFLQLTLCILLLLGNTMFPAFLRTFVYILSLIYKRRPNSPLFQYILQHHHRLCTHLYPLLQTQIYFSVTLILLLLGTGVTFIAELHSPQMVGRSWFNQLTVSFFQTVNTRSGGFNVVDVGSFSYSTLLIYLVMMRIKPQMFCALNEQAYGVETVIGRIRTLEGSEDDPNTKGIQVETEALEANAEPTNVHVSHPFHSFKYPKSITKKIRTSKSSESPIKRRRSFSDLKIKNIAELDLPQELTTNDALSRSHNDNFDSSVNDPLYPNISKQDDDLFVRNEIPRGKSVDFIRPSKPKAEIERAIQRSNTITFGTQTQTQKKPFKTARRGIFGQPLHYLYRSPGEEKPFKVRIVNLMKAFALRLSEHFYSLFVANNLWLLVFLFLLCSIEEASMKNSPVNFTFFKILFELISAYGCVGNSLGYPGSNFSFCAAFTIYSKIIIICTMLIGRHRGVKLSNKDQNFESHLPKYVADFRPTREIAIVKRKNEVEENQDNDNDDIMSVWKGNLQRFPSVAGKLERPPSNANLLNSRAKYRGSDNALDTNGHEQSSEISIPSISHHGSIKRLDTLDDNHL